MAPPETKTFEVSARRFEFEPNIIKVNKGDHVIITLAPEDVEHGLYIDAYEIETSALPGEKTTVEFDATKTGKFPFRCSVTCGGFHPYMIGWLKVGPNLNLIVSVWLAVIVGWFALLTALKRGGVLK